jgi:hypothetical protein
MLDPSIAREASTNIHSQKMGKWRTDSKSAVNSALFWLILGVIRIPHEILNHLLRFLNKQIDDRASDGGHAHQMICGKAQELYSKFTQALFETDWHGIASKASRSPSPVAHDDPTAPEAPANDVDNDKAEAVVRLGVHLLLQCACGFSRRVIEPLNWPGAQTQHSHDSHVSVSCWSLVIVCQSVSNHTCYAITLNFQQTTTTVITT